MSVHIAYYLHPTNRWRCFGSSSDISTDKFHATPADRVDGAMLTTTAATGAVQTASVGRRRIIRDCLTTASDAAAAASIARSLSYIQATEMSQQLVDASPAHPETAAPTPHCSRPC